MWIDVDDLMVLLLIGWAWLLINGFMLAGVARRLLVQRRIERRYRLRLAHWRAKADAA